MPESCINQTQKRKQRVLSQNIKLFFLNFDTCTCITGKHYSVQNHSGCLSDGLFPKAKDMQFFLHRQAKTCYLTILTIWDQLNYVLKQLIFQARNWVFT